MVGVVLKSGSTLCTADSEVVGERFSCNLVHFATRASRRLAARERDSPILSFTGSCSSVIVGAIGTQLRIDERNRVPAFCLPTNQNCLGKRREGRRSGQGTEAFAMRPEGRNLGCARDLLLEEGTMLGHVNNSRCVMSFPSEQEQCAWVYFRRTCKFPVRREGCHLLNQRTPLQVSDILHGSARK